MNEAEKHHMTLSLPSAPSKSALPSNSLPSLPLVFATYPDLPVVSMAPSAVQSLTEPSTNEAPFPQAAQLCDCLTLDASDLSLRTTESITGLPGQPRIALNESSLGRYLEIELVTSDLNKLHGYLWLVGKQDSRHISSLTYQILRGRSIVITENPELHLVWYYDRVFIKPIPKYILSAAFWRYYLSGPHSPLTKEVQQAVAAAAKGFLRSYAYLIRHESDFRIARSENDETRRLLPEGITYAKFTTFISSFEQLDDHEVSPRYAFGELRLSRLNIWAIPGLRRLYFQKVHGQYGAYFMRLYGPIAVVFAFLSVVLNAMQVLVSVQSKESNEEDWIPLVNFSRGFSLFSLALVLFTVVMLLSVFAGLGLREFLFALRDLTRKDKRRGETHK